jgi:hypothetical protein
MAVVARCAQPGHHSARLILDEFDKIDFNVIADEQEYDIRRMFVFVAIE